MQGYIESMNWIAILNGIIVVVGIPTLCGLLVKAGKILKTLEIIETDLKENIRPDLKDVRERFFTLEGKMNSTFASSSPISLLPQGLEILEKSGLKTYIDTHKENLVQIISKQSTFSNPYDIQTGAFLFFDTLPFGEFETKLKESAFQYGMGLETIRRIGGIYFRDILLAQHNFKPEDLDSLK